MQFINGKRTEGNGEVFSRLSPATGEEILRYRLADKSDVNSAVEAAQAAFVDYRRTTPAERADLMRALADGLADHADELAQLESAQTGKSIRLAREFDVPGTIDNAYFFSGAARSLSGLSAGTYMPNSTSMIRREPIGVVGSIAPWNYPLQMAAWKIFPAVAAGNTIVLKASELTPGTSLRLAEIATEVGFPPGVINIIAGTGTSAGHPLVAHPAVAMTSFTGSTAVGREVMATAAAKGARVHLELGGKAPFVVYDDADIEAAARGAVAASTINTGQDCTAATRAIVHESVFDKFVERTAALMESVIVGDPGAEETDMGSLISSQHYERVMSAMRTALNEGTTAVTGGPDAHVPEGCFVAPTLFVDVDTSSSLWKKEVFGPVLAAVPFTTDDQAIDLANDTPFGLAASAWTTDNQRALRAAAEIEAGCVWINEHIPITSDMPHGGYKASGFGKDMSQYSLDEYTQIKHVYMDTSPGSSREWHATAAASLGATE